MTRSTTSEELGRRLHEASALYTQPDAVKYPKRKPPEALAFLVAQAAFEYWPSDVRIDDLDVAVINGEARDAALTIHLNELANF